MTLRENFPATESDSFVRTIVEREVVDSTNDVALELLRDGAVLLPLLVRALRQRRGRGRGSNQWWSDPGSLTFTLAIEPAAHDLERVKEPRVALSTAVAVIDALAELGFSEPAIGIRWPNDLECGERKLGGILAEPVELRNRRLLLIGVGLNVLTKLDQAPEGVREMATSLVKLSTKPIEPDFPARLLAATCRHFGGTLLRLAAGEAGLAERWNALDLLRDRPVRVDVGAHVVTGWGRGIDAEGALCVDKGRETIRLVGEKC